MTLWIPGNSHIESFIELSDVIKMVVPLETVDVLKILKIHWAAIMENFKCPGHSLNMSTAAKKLVKGADSQDHIDQCLACKYFPFSIVCEDIALDFVASGFLSFKYMSQGLDHLLANKKLAKRLALRVEVISQED